MEIIESALLERLPKAYAIASLLAQRERLRQEGVDVIDLSIGEPHLPPPEEAREALSSAARGGAFNRYPAPRGSRELRAAFADFYERRYGHRPDPDRNVLPLLGSKEAIVNLARAFADDRRPVYLGEVGYPVYRAAALQAGARLEVLPGGWEERYVPSFAGRAREPGGVAFVASPANPTGAVLGGDALTSFGEACRERSVVFCYDAAYAELCGEGEPTLPLPLLGEEGIVEFHSLSKSLSLAGWRVGFAVGDPRVIEGLARLKSFTDAGVPTPQQLAAEALLGRCDGALARVRAAFSGKQRAFRAALSSLPLEMFESSAGMFCWIRTDRRGDELAEACLREGILVLPGSVFGAGGERCVRMTVTLAEDRLGELERRLRRIL